MVTSEVNATSTSLVACVSRSSRCPKAPPIIDTYPVCLRCWGGERLSEDVRVAKRLRASLPWRRLGGRGIRLSCRPPRVDCRAVGCVSHVVPDRDAVGAGRGSVHIVTEELQEQVVLARSSRISGRATVQFTPRARRSISADGRVLHHAYQRARARGISA